MNDWQPTALIEVLQKRSDIIRKIREFFYAQNVIEVETPLLAKFGVTDPYNDNFSCDYFGDTYYLQTSPEYHLKRLLAAGAPDLFQLSKAFRYEPCGKHHNCEFTMLEWYRLGFDYHQLIEETLQLINIIIPNIKVKKFTYKNLFEKYSGFDAFVITKNELISYAIKYGFVSHDLEMSKDDWLNLIMSHQIEPQLKVEENCVVIYDFPSSQASLAVIKGEIAQRFEIYINGIELANGFQELAEPVEQVARFKDDLLQRKKTSKNQMQIDSYFIDALKFGLPNCSGVALGIDRLIMAALNLQDIKQVLSFQTSN